MRLTVNNYLGFGISSKVMVAGMYYHRVLTLRVAKFLAYEAWNHRCVPKYPQAFLPIF
jgi:hypothetical protein